MTRTFPVKTKMHTLYKRIGNAWFWPILCTSAFVICSIDHSASDKLCGDSVAANRPFLVYCPVSCHAIVISPMHMEVMSL